MRNGCCSFRLSVNFPFKTTETQSAARSLCGRLQAARRSPKGGGDKSKVPRCSSPNQFSLQPPLLTPSTERKTAAPGSLPSCGKHGQTCSSKALGPAFCWCPDTPQVLYLSSDSVVLTGHRPLRF